MEIFPWVDAGTSEDGTGVNSFSTLAVPRLDPRPLRIHKHPVPALTIGDQPGRDGAGEWIGPFSCPFAKSSWIWFSPSCSANVVRAFFLTFGFLNLHSRTKSMPVYERSFNLLPVPTRWIPNVIRNLTEEFCSPTGLHGFSSPSPFPTPTVPATIQPLTWPAPRSNSPEPATPASSHTRSLLPTRNIRHD